MAVTASQVLTLSAGKSPLMVGFDATGSRSTTITTRTLAHRRLTYYTTWGDPSSGSFGDGEFGVAGSVLAQSRNEGFCSTGSHVFEVADDAGDEVFTVTTYVTDGVTVDNDAHDVTVYDPNGANGYDSTLCVSTDGSTGWGPAGATYTGAQSDFDAAFNTTAGGGVTHDRVLYKRAQSFTSSTFCTFDIDDVHVGAYGSGAAPVVTNSANTGFFEIGPGGNVMQLLRVTGLDCDGSSGDAVIFFNGYPSSPKNVLVKDVRSQNMHRHMNWTPFQWNGTTEPVGDGLFVHDTEFIHSINTSSGNVCYTGAKNLFFAGTSAADSELGEHVWRINYCNVGAAEACDFQAQADSKLVIKLQCAEGILCLINDGDVSQYFNFFNTYFKGRTTNITNPGASWTVVIGPQDSGSPDVVENIVFDTCWFAMSPMQEVALQFWSSFCTCRNSFFEGSGDTTWASGINGFSTYQLGIEPAHSNNELYNNTFISDAAKACAAMDFADGTNHLCYNNLVWYPNGTSVTVVSGGGVTSSNNSTVTQASVNSNTDGSNGPFFAGSNGDGTGTFTTPTHAKILSSSYADGAGSSTLTHMRDAWDISRKNVTPDMGMHQLIAGDDLFDVGGGSTTFQRFLRSGSSMIRITHTP